VYPNPVKDVLHLQLDSSIKDFTFEVTDLNGRKILSIKNQKDVNVSSLKSGVYIGTLISEMGKDSKKFIIE
jgi:aminopeptidase YwaD